MFKKSGYFSSLVTRKTVITVPGRYNTNRGEVVEITNVSARHDFGCTGTYPGGVRDAWHKSGRLFAGCISENDIVRAADFQQEAPQ